MSNIFPKSANKLPLQIIVYLVVLSGILTAGGAHIGGYLFGLFAVDWIEKLHLERTRRRMQA